MKSTCCASITLSLFYEPIVKEYVIPKSTLTKSPWKIYPLLKCINLNEMKNVFEIGGTSRVKIREVAVFSLLMNKIGL